MPHLMALLVREAIKCVEQVGQEEEHLRSWQLARHVGEAHDVCIASGGCKSLMRVCRDELIGSTRLDARHLRTG